MAHKPSYLRKHNKFDVSFHLTAFLKNIQCSTPTHTHAEAYTPTLPFPEKIQ